MSALRTEPRSESPAELADWIELAQLTGRTWRVSEENVRAFLSESTLVDSFAAAIPGAVGVMNRRAKRLGTSYPFVKAPGGLRKSHPSAVSLPYVALLACSQVNSDPTQGHLLEIASLFEQLCETIVPSVGGSGGAAVHFGWPSRSQRPENFAQAILWLATEMGLQIGDGYRDPRRRDGAVDLVSWRVVPGGQTFDHRLIQCTVGRDIIRKSREIDTELWQRWIKFPSSPNLTVAVPYQVPKQSLEMRESQRLGAVVLDRLSLAEVASNALDSAPVSEAVLDFCGLDLAIDAK